MLAVLSPAKKLDFSPAMTELNPTKVALPKDTTELVSVAKKLSQADLAKLMKLSTSLAKLNWQRFQDFEEKGTTKQGKSAALAFSGDTYVGFQATKMSDKELTYAQAHVRILSGLYGLLRPLDTIQPYRLEMGTRLPTQRGKDLYTFWGDKLAKRLSKDAQSHSDPTLVNLASKEYFKAVALDALKVPVLTCTFKEVKAGEAKVVGISAKRARGMMARFMVKERIEAADGLKDFTLSGYRFDRKSSTDTEYVFLRTH